MPKALPTPAPPAASPAASPAAPRGPPGRTRDDPAPRAPADARATRMP